LSLARVLAGVEEETEEAPWIYEWRST
jgi:hypothetical protein